MSLATVTLYSITDNFPNFAVAIVHDNDTNLYDILQQLLALLRWVLQVFLIVNIFMKFNICLSIVIYSSKWNDE